MAVGMVGVSVSENAEATQEAGWQIGRAREEPSNTSRLFRVDSLLAGQPF